MEKLKHRTSNVRALFQGPQPSDEPDMMPEEEQEQLIETLRISDQQANDFFKFILQAFSAMEILMHLAFTTYMWYRTFSHPSPLPDHDDLSSEFRQSASPLTATVFSLISFSMGIVMVGNTSRIARNSLAVWTLVSMTPLILMMGATEFSFELLWWSMPLLLQVVDLVSLWIMKDPEAGFLELEKSQYKLKSA
ncbi:MAG: hypothetical protein J3Q66DRAFT_335873 [Benniella sp.]|nr:MAG: hypothetical protein J3Q66DRAFT_335873 [Benniella sp.]